MANNFNIDQDGLPRNNEYVVILYREFDGTVLCFGRVTQYSLLDQSYHMAGLHNLYTDGLCWIFVVDVGSQAYLIFVWLVLESMIG